MANIQKKYIGILGGSFDPVHKGHLGISKIAIRKFKLKKIYWVVTKKNPFKNKTFYSLNERVNLAKKISRTQKKIQTIYKNLKKKGLILCLCSKNNFNDVRNLESLLGRSLPWSIWMTLD